MSELATRSRGSLHRVAASDFSTAEEVLKTAALLIVPEDQTQRQAFERLMPHLYVLRNRGCSWAQLAKLLAECGFKLQPSTVRTYFSEMLAARMDVCQARMNEQIALYATIRSETAGADVSAISGKVNAFMARLQQAAAPKVNAMFGLDASATVSEAAPNVGKSTATPSLSKPSPPPAPAQIPHLGDESEDGPSSNESAGEYGLLGLPGPSQAHSGRPAGFFNLDESDPTPPAASVKASSARPPAAPLVSRGQPPQSRTKQPSQDAAPIATARAPAASMATGSTSSAKMRLSPLQGGVPPLPKRDNIPADVYDPGKVLEHPAIPGLMLSRDHRLYGAALEYFDEDGEEAGVLKIESQEQKRFRVLWRQKVPVTPTRTGQSFTQIDESLFPTRPSS